MSSKAFVIYKTATLQRERVMAFMRAFGNLSQFKFLMTKIDFIQSHLPLILRITLARIHFSQRNLQSSGGHPVEERMTFQASNSSSSAAGASRRGHQVGFSLKMFYSSYFFFSGKMRLYSWRIAAFKGSGLEKSSWFSHFVICVSVFYDFPNVSSFLNSVFEVLFCIK